MGKHTFNPTQKYAKVRVGGLALDINPGSIEFTDGASYPRVPTTGGPYPRLGFGGGTNRGITFQIELDDGESGKGYTRKVLEHLDQFVPDSEEYLKYASPRTLLFAMGRDVYNCKLEERRVTVTGADGSLNPTRATVDLTLVEIPRAPRPISY